MWGSFSALDRRADTFHHRYWLADHRFVQICEVSWGERMLFFFVPNTHLTHCKLPATYRVEQLTNLSHYCKHIQSPLSILHITSTTVSRSSSLFSFQPSLTLTLLWVYGNILYSLQIFLTLFSFQLSLTWTLLWVYETGRFSHVSAGWFT